MSFFLKVFSQLGAVSKEILHNSSQYVQNRWPQNNLQGHPWCTCELFPLLSISEVTVKSMFRPHRNWIWPTTVIVGNVCLSCLSSTSTSYDTVDKNRVLSSCPSSLRSWTHCSSQWRLTSRPCWWWSWQASSPGMPEKAVGSLQDKNPEDLGRYGSVARLVDVVGSHSILTHKMQSSARQDGRGLAAWLPGLTCVLIQGCGCCIIRTSLSQPHVIFCLPVLWLYDSHWPIHIQLCLNPLRTQMVSASVLTAIHWHPW